MQYRDYGNTGNISLLGFGCMRLPEFKKNGNHYIDEEKAIPMLRRAAELGVNYFDTGYYYCNKNSEATVGRALKPIRDQVLISTKLPLWEVKSTACFRKWLERSLKELDTDYIDYYHIWSLNRKLFDKTLKFGLLKEAEKAKLEGLIRHVSFSFHDDAPLIKEIIDRGEIFETMLVQYNLLDRSNEEMIAYATSKGLGVCAMGPVGGGKLAAPTGLAKRIAGKPHATYELALKYVMANPNIHCALAGMENEDMLMKNIAVANDPNPLSVDEWQQIGKSLEHLRRFSGLYCTACGYCQPCPVGIDIPKIFGAYTSHNVYELSAHAKNVWQEYLSKDGKTMKDCTNCGFCDSKCPQKIAVREQLEKVEGILSKL